MGQDEGCEPRPLGPAPPPGPSSRTSHFPDEGLEPGPDERVAR